MEEHIEYLFQLLNSVLYDKPVPKWNKKIDWKKVCKAAHFGEVLSILYNKMNQIEGDNAPSEEMLNFIKNYSLRMGTKKIQSYKKYSEVLEEAKNRGIKVITFKGPLLAMLYPEPFLRCSCDMDLYVEPKDLSRMEQLLKDMGFKKNEEHSKACVPVYIYENLLLIEAHSCLWEDYKGKTIDKLEAMQLLSPDTLLHVNACGVAVLTLGYEEHLIFLIFHLIKHVAYNGCSIKTIIDIVLYVNTYIDKISKNHFWEKMQHLGYDTFCRTLFSIGCCYLGMTKDIFIDDSYSEVVAETTLKKMYDTYILKASLGDEEERIAASIAYQSYHKCEGKKVGKLHMFMKALFPSSKDLSFRYMYARKHPSLVWIAWIHRAFNQISYRMRKDKQEQVNMLGNVKLANQKLTLLGEMGLMEKE